MKKETHWLGPEAKAPDPDITLQDQWWAPKEGPDEPHQVQESDKPIGVSRLSGNDFLASMGYDGRHALRPEDYIEAEKYELAGNAISTGSQNPARLACVHMQAH